MSLELEEQAEKAILEQVNNWKNVTFAELERTLDEKKLFRPAKDIEKGGTSYLQKNLIEPYDVANLVLWISKNDLLIQTVDKLLREGKIVSTLSHVLVYLADGQMMRMPQLDKRAMNAIKRNPEKYRDKDYWAPVIFNTPEHVTPEQQELKI